MRKEDIIKAIDANICDSNKVRVYFKQFTRVPLWGKFVAIKDHNELSSKGMVRFCINERYTKFLEEKHVMFTRIFNVDSFSLIEINNNELQISTT